MNILGIHYGHNATVALLKDGEVVFALSEERLNRLKNSNGFPGLALDYVYTHLVKPEQIDLAVIFQKDIRGYVGMKNNGFKSTRNFGVGNVNFNRNYSLKKHLLSKTPYYKLRGIVGELRQKLREKFYTNESLEYFSKVLKLPQNKIEFSRHHASHAYACAFNLPKDKKSLIFTMDGEGDGESSTVNIWDGAKLEKLSSNPVQVSLGYFFTEITKLLGMTPNEHEFKVMGLAPYAKQERARELYEKHKNLLWLDENLNWQSALDMRKLEYYFLEKFYNVRFDTISAFAQIFLEEKVLEWVKAWVKKTGIKDLAVGGGVFMSVKLNQKILELPEVESLFVMPSAADESCAIGAAAFGYLNLCKEKKQSTEFKPIQNLYLGIEATKEEVQESLKEYRGKFKVEDLGSEQHAAKKAAELLAQGQVVARFTGRNEWGARALGHRSILAHPSNRDTVRVINEMIKNRDFWMPFASSVLEEDGNRYLVNPKKIQAPFMAITFSTTEEAQKDLTAAIHPYDFTCRPQIVNKVTSPNYHFLISHFKTLTGIGAVLNTSFNLHGEPNVQTPKDALRTLELSGLKYLILGNFLVSK